MSGLATWQDYFRAMVSAEQRRRPRATVRECADGFRIVVRSQGKILFDRFERVVKAAAIATARDVVDSFGGDRAWVTSYSRI